MSGGWFPCGYSRNPPRLPWWSAEARRFWRLANLINRGDTLLRPAALLAEYIHEDWVGEGLGWQSWRAGRGDYRNDDEVAVLVTHGRITEITYQRFRLSKVLFEY